MIRRFAGPIPGIEGHSNCLAFYFGVLRQLAQLVSDYWPDPPKCFLIHHFQMRTVNGVNANITTHELLPCC